MTPLFLQNLPKAFRGQHNGVPTRLAEVCFYHDMEIVVLIYSRFSGPASSASTNKSSTLPLSHRLSSARDKDRDRDRDGYYSDRNELLREREKERERERGYLSDHNSR